MRKDLVYDIPTRLFHWLFVLYFVTAIGITKTVGEHEPTFSYHMMAGLVLGFLVLFRLVWGFVGTEHARFSRFALNPKDLISYLKGVATGDKRRWAGHNPASSWAAVLMLGLGLGLVLTGYRMATGPENDTIKEVHELFANSFLIIALLHIVGIIVHTLRHKEWIGLSMLSGRKDSVPAHEQITQSHGLVGLLLLLAVVGWVTYLNRQYDPKTQQLQLFGQTLQLGELEDDEHEGKHHHEHGKKQADPEKASEADHEHNESEHQEDEHEHHEMDGK